MTGLVCDLGGTNARIGLMAGGRLEADTLARYRNDDFVDFPSVLAAHLQRHGQPRIQSVCIAMAAAPTAEGAQLTNRDWDIRRDEIAQVCSTDAIHFLNDFEALGFSLLRTEELEIRPLFAARETSGGSRLVLGAGTGFNAAACFPLRHGTNSHVSAAECGHMTLPIEGPEELSLQQSLAHGRGRASNERALSGKGLFEIYLWCCQRNGRKATLSMPAEVATHAVAGTDPDCSDAARLFLTLLGRVAGDLALCFLPFGGIYLSGGVTRALSPLITRTPTFLEAFRAKGRQSEFMESFSVSLLLDDLAALTGCAAWMEMIGRPDGAQPVHFSGAGTDSRIVEMGMSSRCS